jgi:hypothetical protein
MANRLNLRRCFLRLTGFGLALAFACFFSSPAVADTISHSGTFVDDGSGNDAATDAFSITNTSPDAYNITTLVIDFSTVATPLVTFDITDFVFVAGPEAGATLFQNATIAPGDGSITLTFTDFNLGESFTFTIDVDDNNAQVDSGRMAGATVTATFDVMGTPTNVAAVMVAGGANDTGWSNSLAVVPEPGTLTLLSLGLAGLAWGGRRRH